MKIFDYDVELTTKNANQEYTGLFVNGKEVKKPTENLPKELLEWFRTQPRVSVRSNGSPKIMFDGIEAQLGYWATSEEEKELYKSSRKGSGTGSSGSSKSSSKVPEGVKEELEALMDTVDEQTKEQLKAIYDKLFPDPRVAKIAALKAQLAALETELGAELETELGAEL